jgi:flagellar FliJ protein
MTEPFKMESVLRHRKHLEEAAQMAFAAALRRLNQARHTLDDLIRNQQAYQQELKRKMQANARADELVRYHRYLGRLDREIGSQTDIVEALEVEKEEKRAALLEALKDRKVLEKLKAHYLETEARGQWAQEQKLMNEAAVNRYQNRQRQADATEKG